MSDLGQRAGELADNAPIAAGIPQVLGEKAPIETR
jgi:hypothetical protein